MKLTFCDELTNKAEIRNIRLIAAFMLILTSLGHFNFLLGQEETAPGKYRIELTDKNNSPFSLDRPEDFLSSRAIQRRQKQSIVLDYRDLPVNPDYIDGIQSTGAQILTISKWFNAITIDNADSSVLRKIMELPFVRPVSLKNLSTYSRVQKKSAVASLQEEVFIDYGYSAHQIAIHKGDKLHSMGYTGKGIHIAILDAGFNNADINDAFDFLWKENRILGYHDFVDPSSSIFHENSHGKTVLSVMGGMIPGFLAGSAPEASFWLLRSEDVNSEYLIEEDNWIAAVEFADSAGVDVINTSLGYSTFNDTTQDHTYAQMDGNSTRISIAADIAASKGMLVVVSAGNEGASSWRYISAPSDADSVLSIGAIDSSLRIAQFSSHGPSSDGRIKPDVCAMGVRVYGIGSTGLLSRVNGTSFSAPIIAGLAACLWQANPLAGVMSIQDAIRKSADRYTQPDTLYGYGIPDFNQANILLKMQKKPQDQPDPVTVFPNPFSSEIYIWLNIENTADVTITLYDLTGRMVYTTHRVIAEDEKYLNIGSSLSFLSQGMYLLDITLNNWQYTTRLLKL